MTISADEDGTVSGLYLFLSESPVATTKEINEDALAADYDKDGKLVGMEILAPVTITSVLDLVEDSPMRESLARFLAGCGPPEFIRA